MKNFILHWRTGQKENISGEDIVDAMTHAGYGGGAARALDYWEEIHPENEHTTPADAKEPCEFCSIEDLCIYHFCPRCGRDLRR